MRVYIQTLTLILFIFSISSFTQVVKFNLPDRDPVILKPYSTITFQPVNEASGVVKSRLWPEVFWVHNDSGDEARIFPVNRNGKILKPEWADDYRGIQIPNAVNVDWEDISTDDEGHLYIGDIGNNSNCRRDLTIYIIKEPFPTETIQTGVYERIPYFYSDQTEFPPKKRNFDSEALFWKNNKLYILTKHRSDTFTKLYRLEKTENSIEHKAVLIDKFDIQGQVSAADISTDGNKLVVLTFTAVWLFEIDGGEENFFQGKIYWIPIFAKQCEAICFDSDNSLIILNEQRDLYKLKIDKLILVKE